MRIMKRCGQYQKWDITAVELKWWVLGCLAVWDGVVHCYIDLEYCGSGL